MTVFAIDFALKTSGVLFSDQDRTPGTVTAEAAAKLRRITITVTAAPGPILLENCAFSPEPPGVDGAQVKEVAVAASTHTT